jgi:hypothetical protein
MQLWETSHHGWKVNLRDKVDNIRDKMASIQDKADSQG